jgi:hypothetical protein
MSAHNPYEAETPAVAAPATQEETATVETPETPAEAPEEFPGGTISEILSWVGEDKGRATVALTAEEADANRKTLVKALKELV